MTVPIKPFRLLKHHATREDYGSCERNNIPTCHITSTHGKYATLEIDFITCDYRLSSYGQCKMQGMLNMELVFAWLRGYNITMNKSNIGSSVIVVKSDMLTINTIITQLNVLSSDTRLFRHKHETDDIQAYVRTTYHPKGNTKILI